MSEPIPMCVGGTLRTRRFRVTFEFDENGLCIAERDHGLSSVYEAFATQILPEADVCVDLKTLEVKEVEE